METQLDLILEKAASLYGVSSKDLKQISEGFQNKIYCYTKSNGDYIMRITSSEKRSREMLNGEISWVQFLKNSGVSVSVAIPSENNQFIEEVHHYYVTSFEKAPGGPVHVQNSDQWNATFFRRWGRTLGQVHDAGKQFMENESNTSRPKWNYEHPYNHELFMEMPSEVMKKKYDELVRKIEISPMDERHFGLIHNDFHQGNFFVYQDKITLFDFDDCSVFYYAYDIATAFYHAYWQHSSYNSAEDDFTVSFFTHFLNGYAETNILTSGMIDQLPVFLKLRELFLYVLFLKVWDIEHLQDWQDYTIRNLKTSIENNTIYARLDTKLLNQIKQNLKKPL
jgi:amicoumacin kinase